MNNLERFGRAMEWSDLPHYYNERATLSLFAAACWQSGLVALEEFVCWKGKSDDAFSGRADLWALCPITGTDVIIEAKQMWPSQGTQTKTVQGWLDQADEEALKNGDTGMRAGLTFLVPSLDPSVEREDVVALFRRLHDDVLACNIDALAWWMPEEAMEHRSLNRNNGEERMWPGILAVLRVVRIRGRSNPIPKKERLRETVLGLAPVPA